MRRIFVRSEDFRHKIYNSYACQMRLFVYVLSYLCLSLTKLHVDVRDMTYF